jgi:hypothetical protein
VSRMGTLLLLRPTETMHGAVGFWVISDAGRELLPGVHPGSLTCSWIGQSVRRSRRRELNTAESRGGALVSWSVPYGEGSMHELQPPACAGMDMGRKAACAIKSAAPTDGGLTERSLTTEEDT